MFLFFYNQADIKFEIFSVLQQLFEKSDSCFPVETYKQKMKTDFINCIGSLSLPSERQEKTAMIIKGNTVVSRITLFGPHSKMKTTKKHKYYITT